MMKWTLLWRKLQAQAVLLKVTHPRQGRAQFVTQKLQQD
jgi:hypothetical protein